MMLFHDRSEAGEKLAAALAPYANRPNVLVLALPRGGVPVAYEVAEALRAPLDVLVVRKLGVPGQEELAMGAIASRGACVLYDAVVRELRIPEDEIDAVTAEEEFELKQRERLYRGDRPPADVREQIVILVDDGIATGSSARAAIAALRRREPARIVLAVPVAPPESCEELDDEVDELVCLVRPKPFLAVGQWYRNFLPVSDAQVHDLIERASLRAVAG